MGEAGMQAAEAGHTTGQGLPSQAVIASMHQHGIRFTANHYAVWQSYLSGSNAAVTRAIDIVLSNGGTIDSPALQRIYARLFCPAQGALAVGQAARRGLEQLREARALLHAGADPPALNARLEQIEAHLQQLTSANQAVIARLSQSEERIAMLESYLNDATRDASTDALTGLLNRRAFDTTLRGMAAEAMNSGADLAVVLVDVDLFKRVNDQWGHGVGDDVLRHVATLLMRTVRGGDLVARYGGEEFAVILARTGRRGAIAVAENLREAIASNPHVLPSTAENGETGVNLRITISAGVACFSPGESIAAWLNRADRALYGAKNAGRNRVLFDTPPGPQPGRARRPTLQGLSHPMKAPPPPETMARPL